MFGGHISKQQAVCKVL